MIKHKKRKLTEEESIILDCWYQYSFPRASKKLKVSSRWAGCHSAMESCESYLREHKIINSWGNKRPEIIW